MQDHHAFDRQLPSPLEAVMALRCSGADSVVATGKTTAGQKAMYVPTGLDERLRDRMLQSDPPSLVILGGSAGGGKSALIRRLQDSLASGTFTKVIEDATHAEAPDQDQASTLAEALSGFRSGVPPHGERILIAANTGLLLRLEQQFRTAQETGLAELVAFALYKLGVPAAPHVADARFTQLEASVLVVDLDQRPTSGADDRLLRSMLSKLDPDDPDGVLAGAARCRTCTVRHYCAPRTNLELLSDPAIARVLDEAVEHIAVLRGKDLPPRQLWDGVAELALGGVTPPASGDPCDAIAAIAAIDDKVAVWRSLLPGGPVSGRRATTVLCRELAELDPSYQPTVEAHNLIAATGVDPDADAERLLSTIGGNEPARPAVATAAHAVHEADEDLPKREVARGLIRAAWLAGYLPLRSSVPAHFYGALRSGDHDSAVKVIELVGQGLVRAFGYHAEGTDYLPTEGLAELRSTRVLAKVDLTDGQLIDLLESRPSERNPQGSTMVDARPLTGRLRIGQAELVLDYSLFRLLQAAAEGTVATTIDIERYHSLRHAAATLGRTLANDQGTALLVLSDSASVAYRVGTVRIRNKTDLQIKKVG